MAKSKVNVSLWDDNGTLHLINAGDDLPSWAKVGDHVTNGVEEPTRTDTDIDHAKSTTAIGTATAEPTPSAPTGPDFTKPAAPKRTSGK